jgi:hypothetical protein
MQPPPHARVIISSSSIKWMDDHTWKFNIHMQEDRQWYFFFSFTSSRQTSTKSLLMSRVYSFSNFSSQSMINQQSYYFNKDGLYVIISTEKNHVPKMHEMHAKRHVTFYYCCNRTLQYRAVSHQDAVKEALRLTLRHSAQRNMSPILTPYYSTFTKQILCKMLWGCCYYLNRTTWTRHYSEFER